jgi:hypothetical protein
MYVGAGIETGICGSSGVAEFTFTGLVWSIV